MQFHAAFTPAPFPVKINHRNQLFLVGSCFTENIGTKLKQCKFSVAENPNGILFNPVSIVKSLHSYIHNKQFVAEDLFYANECWNSWEHHSRFSAVDQQDALNGINASQQAAHVVIQQAQWLMITVGSAFVYELKEGATPLGQDHKVVANCHKVPTDKFNKRLLGVEEIIASFQEVLTSLFAFNPAVKIIFTISPVRHLRDGFVENNRSKAALIQAIHALTEWHSRIFYFPAYELVIDDLRDYRFYAEDLAHPNYAATNYVWEKFITACIDEPSQQLMKELQVITAAYNHKPFNPTSSLHQQFLASHLAKAERLLQLHPYLSLTEEIAYFRSGKRPQSS